MRRLLTLLTLLTLLLLGANLAPSSAAPPASKAENMVIAVIAADPESTRRLAESVKAVRDANSFSKSQIPIAVVSATRLKPADFERIGFPPSSLPVVALMKISSANNLESVWGKPPAIVRNVTKAEVAAQLILCRWAEYASVQLPPNLQQVSQIFRPNQVCILNCQANAQAAEAVAREITRVRNEEGIGESELPVLSLAYGEGLLTPEDYDRLGFGANSLPAIGLVQMSDCGNPQAVVGDGLLRYSFGSAFASREVVRQWLRLKSRSPRKIPASEPFSFQLSSLKPSLERGKLPADKPVTVVCKVENFRFGPEARVWVQQDTRILRADGSPVPNLGGQTNHKLESAPEAQNLLLESSFQTPSLPGKYLLEVTLRDKMGNARVQRSSEFEI